MTKRVARFTGQSTNGSVTPFKVYDVFNEGENLFNLIDDNGNTRFCSKQCCGHICGGNWEIADVVEQTVKQDIVEEDIVTTKQPKWSKWIKNTTGKCPEGLKRKQKIKLKWSDGDKFVIDNPHDAAWCIDEGVFAVNITHYKVKLKDQEKPKSKWTKNTGVCPVNGNIAVMMKFSDGTIDRTQAQEYSWDFGQTRKIIKWRLAG
jgi:hypothetical protein